MIRLCLYAIFLVLVAAPCGKAETYRAAPADRVGAADLYQYCRGLTNIDAGYCAGYISAVADIMKDQTLYDRRACHIERISPQQLMDLLTRSMANDAVSLRQRAAGPVLADKLAQYYPCE